MLGDSAVLGTGGGSSGDDAVAAVVAAAAASSAAGGGGGGGGGGHDGGDTVVGGGGSNSGDDERGRGEEGDRSFGGNRWPRQETLALLRIRADMDVAFRDASVKGPLWEEVSRKLAELGHHRNAKKCKEKFENVYKYHKRTKEGRSGKSDGKTYRFFDQLEALENNPSILSPTTTTPQHSKQPLNAKPVSVIVTTSTLPIPQVANTTVPSTTTTTTTLPIATTMPQAILNTPSINLTIPSFPPPNPTNFTLSSTPTNPPPFPNNIPTDLFSNSSSSSTSSDDTLEGGRRKRKRKWKDFFERLMKEVIDKQEELQRRFLEAIEKRERERVAREEAWRMQEMQRINREREILAQERSIAAAKDAAVMSFLQKIAEQQNLGPALNNSNFPMPQATVPSPPPPPSQPAGQVIIHPGPQQHQQQHQQQQVTNMEIIEANNNNNNNGENLMMQASSSRWPKVEVQALINLRTNLEAKYQETGPKGPLWEEISSLMRKIGYNRSAKRCKEKWENINKYFKKVKESNKKRPEDSKTCPYFHLLEALYKEKSKHESPLKLDTTVAPLMVRPEQQWPPQLAATAENDDSADHRPRHQHEEEDDDGGDDEEEKEIGDDDDEDEDDEGGGNNYEIVASKPASSVGVSAE